jgi:hypothetical protein
MDKWFLIKELHSHIRLWNEYNIISMQKVLFKKNYITNSDKEFSNRYIFKKRIQNCHFPYVIKPNDMGSQNFILLFQQQLRTSWDLEWRRSCCAILLRTFFYVIVDRNCISDDTIFKTYQPTLGQHI